MKIWIAVLVSILICGLIVFKSSQPQTGPLSSFIPQGYESLKETKGDLNADGTLDVILVLKSTDPKKLGRELVLLLGQGGESYKLAVKNSHAIYQYDYDPNFKESFMDISTASGKFEINHYGGFAQRWSRGDVFVYDPAKRNWFLSEIALSTFNATDPGSGTEKKYTAKDFGKISFSKFNIDKLSAQHLL